MTFNCYASTLATLAKNNMQKKLSMRFLTTVFLLIGLLAAKSADAFPLQLPAGSSATGNTPLEQARRSFMGNDLAGKNGPMRKVGPDLALVFHEHRDYKARGGIANVIVQRRDFEQYVAMRSYVFHDSPLTYLIPPGLELRFYQANDISQSR